MKISVITFTKKGIELSKKIKNTLPETTLFTKYGQYEKEEGISFVEKRLPEWAGEQFQKGQAVVFIGACGIAVRSIAPHIANKLQDSPVLVIDELGQYVIPILSGHVGGANELATLFSEKIGAVPVITTATDINHKFAVDLFAKKKGLWIVNKEGIAKVSSKVLAEQTITLSIETGHYKEGGKLPEGVKLTDYPPTLGCDIVITSEEKDFLAALRLCPKEYAIGIGCKRGKEAEKIEAFIEETLEKNGICLSQVFALASLDVKKEEAGLLAWSEKKKIPFFTYTAEELGQVEGEFEASDFVQKTVGVDNVCERAALKQCGEKGRLAAKKYAHDGMTIALAKKEWRVDFFEE